MLTRWAVVSNIILVILDFLKSCTEFSVESWDGGVVERKSLISKHFNPPSSSPAGQSRMPLHKSLRSIQTVLFLQWNCVDAHWVQFCHEIQDIKFSVFLEIQLSERRTVYSHVHLIRPRSPHLCHIHIALECTFDHHIGIDKCYIFPRGNLIRRCSLQVQNFRYKTTYFLKGQ